MREIVDTTERLSDPYEARLVERARGGEEDAWTAIYSQHYAALFRYIHARVFDRETTEDLTSSVFVAAIKGIESYTHRGRPLLAWLYRIARNVVSSHQRRMLGNPRSGATLALDLPRRAISSIVGRFGATEGDLSETVAAPGPGGGDPALLVERMDLRAALTTLTPAQREIIILRFFVGLSTQEVADVIGKAPAAVYSMHARALQSLKRQLQ